MHLIKEWLGRTPKSLQIVTEWARDIRAGAAVPSLPQPHFGFGEKEIMCEPARFFDRNHWKG